MLPSTPQSTDVDSVSEHSVVTKDLEENSPSVRGNHCSLSLLASLQLHLASTLLLGVDENPAVRDASLSSSMFDLSDLHQSQRSLLPRDEPSPSCHQPIHSYDQDYAKLLGGTIVLRPVPSSSSSASVPSVPLPFPGAMVELPRQSITAPAAPSDTVPSGRFYLLRVPVRQSNSRMMHDTARLARLCHVRVRRMLLDGTHDATPDFGLLVAVEEDGTGSEALREFCEDLQLLRFVRAAPSVLPVVVV